MTIIQENIELLQNQLLAKNVTLVAVSKTKPVAMLMEAYAMNFKRFGENYVQELVEKHEAMPKDIEWHMIGHLQTNKVKYITSFVSLIHSVDSYKLLAEINKQAAKNERTINCLLQVYIAEEDSKTGMTEQELLEVLENIQHFPNVNIKGLMGMSTFTDNEEQVKKEFRKLKQLQEQLVVTYAFLQEISMGMSGDWKIAVQEGSTMVRVGSAIFGNRLTITN
jgi:PLP dependent protein